MRNNNANLLMNRLLPVILSLLGVHLYSKIAFCSEDYYIDNQRTLLYKVINQWYDCLPKECDSYCGAAIKCTNQGNAQIEYSEADMILKLRIEEGLADLLSVFRNCNQCFGPSYLHCTWRNGKYLGNGKTAIVADLNQFVFYSIDRNQAQIIKSIRDDLLFVVEGIISGLLNDGKVVLHQAGAFLKNCPKRSDGQGNSFPISVKIMNAKSYEIIAEYQAIWTD